MIRNIGIRTLSNKKKKDIKSIAEKTAIKKISKENKQKKYS